MPETPKQLPAAAATLTARAGKHVVAVAAAAAEVAEAQQGTV